MQRGRLRLTDLRQRGDINGPYEEVNLNELQHTTLMDTDPHMPTDVVRGALAGHVDLGRQGGSSTLYFDLQHNTNAHAQRP